VNPLSPQEGDVLVEGRFGNSIRLGSSEGKESNVLIRSGQGVEELHHNDAFSYDLDYNPTEKDDLSDFIDKFVGYCHLNLSELFPKTKDAQVADAILSIFEHREGLDIFNKKALYIYIREMVDVKTPHITKIANRLFLIYKKGYIFYQEHGYIEFE